MNSFTVERFSDHINHVDADLRMMALFDLKQYVSSTARPKISTVIVDKTLQCLTRGERKTEVRQEAVSTIPVMAVACPPPEQIKVLRFLLASTSAPPPPPDQLSVFLDLQDLCTLTLKTTVTAIINAAHRDTAYWQQVIPTIQQYTNSCAETLISVPEAVGKDAVYATLNTIVPVFGNALDGKCVDVMLTQSLKDTQVNASLRRAAVTCCASLAPFAHDGTLKQMQGTLTDALRKLSGDALELHLQLFEAVLRSDRVRMQSCMTAVTDSLIANLGKASETYDTALGVSDAILRIFELAFLSFSIAMPAGSAKGVMAVCETLATFDPNYCGTGETVPAYEEDYEYHDDYYDGGYDNEVDDSTWKLRKGALRVIMAIINANDDADVGARALSVGTAALQDRMQDTQLEAFNLITAVAAKPYCSAVQLSGDVFHALVSWASNGGDPSSLAALKAIESIFRTTQGCSEVLGTSAVEGLTAILQSTPSDCVRYLVDTTQTCRAVLESLLNGGSHELACRLSDALLSTCGSAASPSAPQVVIAVLRCNHLLADVAISAPSVAGLKVAQAAVEVLAGLAHNSAVDDCCRVSAVEALGVWASTHGLDTHADRALAAIDECLSDMAVSACAARCVLHLPVGEMGVQRIPAGMLCHLTALITTNADATCRTSMTAAALLVGAGVAFSREEAAAWTSSAAQTAAMCQSATFPACAESSYALLTSALNLITAAHRQQPKDVSVTDVMTKLVTPTWSCLSTSADDISAFGDVLTSLVGLTRAIAPQEARRQVMDHVTLLLTKSRAPIQKKCIAAGAAIPAPPAAATEKDAEAVLVQLQALQLESPSLLLCIGAVGRLAPLPKPFADMLLDNVQDDQAELVRASAEVGLAASMTNSHNRALVTEVMARITGAEPVRDRYYYLKAIRTAVSAAPSSPAASCFTDAAECQRLLEALLEEAPQDDLTEVTAGCIGAVAQLFPALCTDIISATLRSERGDLRVVCTVALRFVLEATVSHGESTAVIETLVMDYLCDKVLKLTASPSVPIKTAVLRLLTGQPSWVEGRPQVMRCLLVELRDNPKLVGTVSIGAYSHRTDKGLEMRKTAFECVSAILSSDLNRGTHILESCDAISELLDAFIHSCGSTESGEVDAFLNNEAKLLLVNLLLGFPSFRPSTEQIERLCGKLSADFESYSSDSSQSDKRKTLLPYTIYVILQLSRSVLFFHHGDFRKLLHRAQRCDLLPLAAKM